MKVLPAAAFFLFMSGAAEARSYDDIMTEARDAFAADDMALAADLLDEAQTLHPYSLYILRNRILTRILTGRMDEAIALADEIADRGLVLETPPNESFEKMRTDAAFAPVAKKMEENASPLGDASVIYEDEASDLLPEALSMGGGAYFIGSIRTGAVFEIQGGSLREITKAGGGVFDLELRGDGRLLAATNNQLAYEGRSGEPFAALAEFDVKTGEATRLVEFGPGPALIGDIEIAKSGRIFASDSLTPRIFSILPDNAGAERQEIVDDRFVNLQGVALDERRERLYVADYLAGLFVVDLEAGTVEAIANPSDAHLGGIDGLYLYKGDLVGVQNGTTPQRIVRIRLDRKGKTVRSLKVLQRALPEWNEPTHGVINNGNFVYIATSNWPAYDDEGTLKEDARLKPLRLMSVRLK